MKKIKCCDYGTRNSISNRTKTLSDRKYLVLNRKRDVILTEDPE